MQQSAHKIGTRSPRADCLDARMQGRTAATSATEWLQELVEEDSEEVGAWREVAVGACQYAVSAHQRARGKGPSVVPQEDR